MHTLLVAVSEPEIRRRLLQIYQQDRYNVVESENADNCLAVVEARKPDVVVLSSTLNGTDSFLFCTHLKANYKVPVLLIVEAAEVGRALEAGADDVLLRPVDPLLSSLRIKQILKNREIHELEIRGEWYRSVIDNAIEGVFRSTPGGKFLYVNPAMVHILGYNSVDEVLALNIPTDVYYDAEERTYLQRYLRDEDAARGVELVWKRRDGYPVFVESFTRIVRDNSQKVLYYEGVVMDVTLRKQAEAAEREQRLLTEVLRDSIALLNSATDLESILDSILTFVKRVVPNDLANIFLIDDEMVARSVRRHGYQERGVDDQVGNVRLLVYDLPHLRALVETNRTIMIEDTRTFPGWKYIEETEWIRSAIGTCIRSEGKVIGLMFLDSARPAAFTSTHIETLQIFADQAGIAIRNAQLYEAIRNHAQELEKHVEARTAELAQERVQLQIILDSIGEGVYGLIFAEDGQQIAYSFINPALYHLLGYKAYELDRPLPLKPDDMPEQEFKDAVRNIRETARQTGIWKGTVRLKRKDGELIDLEMVTSRVNRPDGQVMGMVTILRDIRQQKALDAQKKRFVASAAHELRNPISSLTLRMFLVEKQPEKLQDHLDVMGRIVNHLERLVEDLLDLSRFEHGLIKLKNTETNLSRFVLEMVDIQQPEADQRQIQVVRDMQDAEALTVSLDPSRISQVVNNLLTNAINHTPEGGIITVCVRKGKAQTHENGYAILEITDTGPGIPPEHLPYIFEAFYRVREGGRGLGLGLNIIKEIVELHGGKIEVRSELGKGTVFIVYLKLVANPSQSS